MRRLLIGLALGTLVLGACGKSESPTVAASPTAAATTAASSAPKENNHGSKEFMTKDFTTELEADNDNGDFYFKPTVITAQKGGKATLELHNEGDAEHNFSITSLGIDQDLEKGEKKTVTVNLPSDAGQLAFFCKYHVSSGMAGHFVLH